jgi:hypothetical protein
MISGRYLAPHVSVARSYLSFAQGLRHGVTYHRDIFEFNSATQDVVTEYALQYHYASLLDNQLYKDATTQIREEHLKKASQSCNV